MGAYRSQLEIGKRAAKLVLAQIERAGYSGECGECAFCAGDLEPCDVGFVVECPSWAKFKIRVLNKYSYGEYKGKGGLSI